ncbi:MAG TPA: kinase [Erysipelotrichaceae bacterium]|nr:kinase [Erysipelotrichaceae bacterium]
MTQREQEILNILKQEPTISQNDIASRLGITRSSVAVHITNLLKKGYLLGKGYIVQDEPYVLVIGGSNVDIQGFPKEKLIHRDSNIGTVKVSLGGVGRNIAENCARLGVPTRLMSVIGDDPYGQKILKEAQAIGLNMQDTIILSGEVTSTYLSILDETHDMALAINHMDSIEKLTVDHIRAKRSIIEHAQLVVLDTNLSQSVLDHLLTQYPKTKFFVDTVSTKKALKIKDHLKNIHTLKPNRMEAEVLTGGHENTSLLELGGMLKCKRSFISIGSQGVQVFEGKTHHHFPTLPIEVINATGAGDAFMAGLVYAYLKGYELKETCSVAMAASRLALSHPDTINPNLNEQTLHETLKELQHV